METTRAAPAVLAFKPGLGAADAEAVRAAIESGWTGSGVYVRLFERRVARAAGTAHALAVSSGTAALHLALKLAGVAGGEVITTPLTSPATNHAILYNGAIPVFCDVEEDTGNLDPRLVERRMTPRTRAILAVHFNGHPCDMDALRGLARERGVPLVEDAGADRELEEALRLQPRFAEAWLASGSGYSQSGRNAEARACFEKALDIAPENPITSFGLADFLAKTGEPVRAAALYRAALALAPDYLEAWVNLAALHRDQGDFQQARSCYEKAISLAGSDPVPFLSFALLLEKFGRSQEAWAMYAAALARRPGYPPAQAGLSRLKADHR